MNRRRKRLMVKIYQTRSKCSRAYGVLCARVVIGLLVSFLWSFWLAVGNLSAQQSDLSLQITLQTFDPTTGNIIVRGTITNTGPIPLLLPHVTGELLQEPHIRWAGWGFSVRKCPLGVQFYYHFWRPLPPKKDQLIELKPGEHFALTANLSTMLPRGISTSLYAQERGFPMLSNVPGQYEVYFYYDGATEEVSRAPHFLRDRSVKLWEGSSSSNTLRFVNTIEKPRMYFPGEQLALESPDARHTIINFDNPPSAGGNVALGTHTLYLRDTTTGEQLPIYTYPHQVEVLWSPQGTGILITDYRCGEGEEDYSFSLIFRVDRKELIDLRQQLWQATGYTSNIIEAEWVSEDRLIVKVSRDFYEYNLLEGLFKKVE